jgi:hypothetical protein
MAYLVTAVALKVWRSCGNTRLIRIEPEDAVFVAA